MDDQTFIKLCMSDPVVLVRNLSQDQRRLLAQVLDVPSKDGAYHQVAEQLGYPPEQQKWFKTLNGNFSSPTLNMLDILVEDRPRYSVQDLVSVFIRLGHLPAIRVIKDNWTDILRLNGYGWNPGPMNSSRAAEHTESVYHHNGPTPVQHSDDIMVSRGGGPVGGGNFVSRGAGGGFVSRGTAVMRPTEVARPVDTADLLLQPSVSATPNQCTDTTALKKMYAHREQISRQQQQQQASASHYVRQQQQDLQYPPFPGEQYNAGKPRVQDEHKHQERANPYFMLQQQAAGASSFSEQQYRKQPVLPPNGLLNARGQNSPKVPYEAMDVKVKEEDMKLEPTSPHPSEVELLQQLYSKQPEEKLAPHRGLKNSIGANVDSMSVKGSISSSVASMYNGPAEKAAAVPHVLQRRMPGAEAMDCMTDATQRNESPMLQCHTRNYMYPPNSDQRNSVESYSNSRAYQANGTASQFRQNHQPDYTQAHIDSNMPQNLSKGNSAAYGFRDDRCEPCDLSARGGSVPQAGQREEAMDCTETQFPSHDHPIDYRTAPTRMASHNQPPPLSAHAKESQLPLVNGNNRNHLKPKLTLPKSMDSEAKSKLKKEQNNSDPSLNASSSQPEESERKSGSASGPLESGEFKKGQRTDVRVVITYSHDNDRHAHEVVGLTKCLRNNGFAVTLDGNGVEMTEAQFLELYDRADVVLVCVSPLYHRRVEKKAASQNSSDGKLNTVSVYEKMRREFWKGPPSGRKKKLLCPLMFPAASPSHLPQWMVNLNRYQWPGEWQNLMFYINRPEKLVERAPRKAKREEYDV